MPENLATQCWRLLQNFAKEGWRTGNSVPFFYAEKLQPDGGKLPAAFANEG